MLFNEIYSSYYNVMAEVIRLAVKGELTEESLVRAANENAFSESFLEIVPSVKHERWQLVTRNLDTPIRHSPDMPLTLLQKKWLKAISLDPRFILFGVKLNGLDDVEPLFAPDDYVTFDKYGDGDPYRDNRYIENFRTVYGAIKNGYWLVVKYMNHRGNERNTVCKPVGLEYSEKDDKFRAILGDGENGQINIQRIIKCSVIEKGKKPGLHHKVIKTDEIVFDVKDERNALERAMLEFAYHRKECEKTGPDTYRVRLWYDRSDRTELLIRILSFGPLIKVIEPESFIDDIRNRLLRQKKCGL